MAHFFENDLPLPLARKLQPEKLAPPEQVRAAREAISAHIAALALPRLSAEERALLDQEVPVVDEWYSSGRSYKLFQFEHLLRYAGNDAPPTAVTKELLDALSKGCHRMSSLGYLQGMLVHLRHDGLLVVDVLLSRGLQRIEQALRTQLRKRRGAHREALKELWERIARLREEGTPAAASDGRVEAAAAPAGAGGTRPLLPLAEGIAPEKLDGASNPIIHEVCELHVPQLSPNYHDRYTGKDKDMRKLIERLRKLVDADAVPLLEACLRELYPAEPWVAEQSGVAAEALRLLLAWRKEYDRFGPIAERFREDLADAERLLWLRGRHLIRTIFNDYADAAIKSGEQFSSALFHLSCSVGQMRRSPPPRLVRQWVRERRREIERRWRARLAGE